MYPIVFALSICVLRPCFSSYLTVNITVVFMVMSNRFCLFSEWLFLLVTSIEVADARDMFAKHYTRSGVFAWSPRECPEQGLVVVDYAQQFSALSSSKVDTTPAIDYVPLSSIYAQPRNRFKRETSVHSDFKCNDLCWTSAGASEEKPFGLIVAGCENGSVIVFDATKIVRDNRLETLCSRRDHVGHVLTVDVSADKRWAMSGGGSGQLLLWDLANLASPFSPGAPTYPDQVKCVRWNGKMESIVASLSSHRCSLWDLRRNGAPIMDIGEVGGGCDWADACWSPLEETALLTASQSDTVPVLYKWDLRYPTAPVRDHRIHAKGITAIDWHQADGRLLLSASHDGTMLISNVESGETLGRVGVRRDWVRRVRWAPGKPELVAIQYFQSAVQISSLQSMGVNEDSSASSASLTASPSPSSPSSPLSPTHASASASSSTDEEAALLAPTELSVVPEWCSAGSCGVSFSMGGRHVVHSRSRDEHTGRFSYAVEIRRPETSSAVYESAMALQNAIDGGGIGAYCEEKALSSSSESAQLLWTFLSAAVAGQGRNESVRILGFDKTHAQNGSGELVNGMAALNCGGGPPGPVDDRYQPDDDDSDDLLAGVADLPEIDYGRMDAADWSLLDSLIAGDTDRVVDDLIARGDLSTALLLAREDERLLRRVARAHARASTLSPSSRLLSLISARHFSPLLRAFPPAEWRRLLGVILRADPDPAAAMPAVADKIVQGSSSLNATDAAYCAAIPAVLSGDVEGMLSVNGALSIEERVQQAIVLRSSRAAAARKAHDAGVGVCDELWESVLESHCRTLISEGLMDHAWRLMCDTQPRSTSLVDLRFSLWEACGGQARTQRAAPPNPHAGESSVYAAALRPVATQAASAYGTTRRGTLGSVSSQTSGYAGMAAPPPPPVMQQPYGGMQSGAYGAPVAAPSTMGAPPVYAGATAPYQQPLPVAQQPMYQQSQNQYSTQPAQLSPSSEQGPSPAVASATPGWNDPPPLPMKKVPEARPPSVMQISWQPAEPPSPVGMGPLGGRAPLSMMAGPPGGMMTMGGQQQPGAYGGMPPQQQQMMGGAAPVGVGQYPASAASSMAGGSSAQCSPVLPQVSLNDADTALMQKLERLAAAIVAQNRTPASVRKADDLIARLKQELAPRLSAAKLTPQTRTMLDAAVDAAYAGDMQRASGAIGALVRTGGDFVEVSAFQPSLKSLFTLYSHSFGR